MEYPNMGGLALTCMDDEQEGEFPQLNNDRRLTQYGSVGT